MSVTSLLSSSLRSVSNCVRTYCKRTTPASCAEVAVHKALGTESAYRNIGIGPFTAYKIIGQQTSGALTDHGRKMPIRAYQFCKSFVRRYQSGRGPNSPNSSATVLKTVIGANGLVWMYWQLDPAFMDNHFVTSLRHLREGRWYTIVTAAFSHSDPLHLFGNMMILYLFWDCAFSGRLVIFLYLVGGAAGSAAFLYQEYRQLPSLGFSECPDTQVLSSHKREMGETRCLLGASGSVNTIVIFSILSLPRVLMSGVVPIPWVLGCLWLASDISGVMTMERELTPGEVPVAHIAHLGGAAAGALIHFAHKRIGRLRL